MLLRYIKVKGLRLFLNVVDLYEFLVKKLWIGL
jgi:hypothetical protein